MRTSISILSLLFLCNCSKLDKTTIILDKVETSIESIIPTDFDRRFEYVTQSDYDCDSYQVIAFASSEYHNWYNDTLYYFDTTLTTENSQIEFIEFRQDSNPDCSHLSRDEFNRQIQMKYQPEKESHWFDSINKGNWTAVCDTLSLKSSYSVWNFARASIFIDGRTFEIKVTSTRKTSKELLDILKGVLENSKITTRQR